MRTPPMFLDQREEWFEAAAVALEEVAASMELFTTDDLRDKIPPPGNPNWWGILFRRFVNMGRIQSKGFQTSRTSTRKGGVLRVWTQTTTK